MKKIVLGLLVSVAFARELPRVDPRLKEIHSVFVFGNNHAAEKIRLLMANEASDAPFASGVDTAGKGLYRRLKLDVCEK